MEETGRESEREMGRGIETPVRKTRVKEIQILASGKASFAVEG